MRLKLSFPKEGEHTDTVTCVAWNTNEEIYSCGNDRKLLKWNLLTTEAQKVCELPPDVSPVDFHTFSRNTGIKKQGQDVILITSSDGRFHFIGKSGRLEKSVEAHKGAALVGQLSPDGASLLTAGEDGLLKIWSRSGMLRSTVAQISTPIYSACWSSDSGQVLYTQNKYLIIKPLAPNSKPNRWKAHEALVLKVAWNFVNGFIVSGGEDCRYKVWDSFGRQIYSSIYHEQPIKSVAWSPSGELFAVGSYNAVRLCDKSGWSHCLEKPETGSLFSIAWSSDGTQFAAACADKKILVAHVVGRKVEWGQMEAVSSSRKSVTVTNLTTDDKEKLEYQERVIHLTLAYKYLVVVTQSQIYVYTCPNLNTPTVLDLREGSVSMLLTSPRHFMIVERASATIYSYDGRLNSSPRWNGMNVAALTPGLISLSIDTIAVREFTDERVIQIVDLNGKDTGGGSLQHSSGIAELGLSQVVNPMERLLAFVDKNRDIYVSTVAHRPTLARKIDKLGGIVESFKWHSNINVIAAMQETALTLWYYPMALFVDKSLTKKTTHIKDSSEFGRSPLVASFVGNLVAVRRADGALVYSYVLPYVALLHDLAASTSWDEALRLCRLVDDPSLWACLAGMATYARDPNTAELAYAAINMYDKVMYIQHIKEITLKPIQSAEMCLIGGNVQEAETILLQNGLPFRAIWSNINSHNWNRALELAVRHKTHIDTVLAYRKKYLDGFDKTETNEKFLQVSKEVKFDVAQVAEKVASEFKKEMDSK